MLQRGESLCEETQSRYGCVCVCMLVDLYAWVWDSVTANWHCFAFKQKFFCLLPSGDAVTAVLKWLFATAPACSAGSARPFVTACVSVCISSVTHCCSQQAAACHTWQIALLWCFAVRITSAPLPAPPVAAWDRQLFAAIYLQLCPVSFMQQMPMTISCSPDCRTLALLHPRCLFKCLVKLS